MIYLITGLMASGKSTVAELLSRRLPRAVHLRGDVFRRMITSGRVEMGEEPAAEAYAQLRLRYRLTASAAIGYAAAGFEVVVQDNYYGAELPYMLSLLEGQELKLFVLNPSREALSERERGRGKTGYHSLQLEGLHRAFLVETPRLGLWIDSSHQTPEETLEVILQSLEA